MRGNCGRGATQRPNLRAPCTPKCNVTGIPRAFGGGRPHAAKLFEPHAKMSCRKEDDGLMSTFLPQPAEAVLARPGRV